MFFCKESKKEKAASGSMLRRCVITFAVSALILVLAGAGLIVYVDPFFQYHSPLPGFPYVVDNQLSQNPGMAKNMEYDSVILGYSMTVNFNTNWFSELMVLNTL